MLAIQVYITMECLNCEHKIKNKAKPSQLLRLLHKSNNTGNLVICIVPFIGTCLRQKLFCLLLLQESDPELVTVVAVSSTEIHTAKGNETFFFPLDTEFSVLGVKGHHFKIKSP